MYLHKDIVKLLNDRGANIHHQKDKAIIEFSNILYHRRSKDIINYILSLDIPESFTGIKRFRKDIQNRLLDQMTVESASENANLDAANLLLERKRSQTLTKMI